MWHILMMATRLSRVNKPSGLVAQGLCGFKSSAKPGLWKALKDQIQKASDYFLRLRVKQIDFGKYSRMLKIRLRTN
jgi:hypothetical protein